MDIKGLRRMAVHDIERYQEHRFAKVSGSTVNRETAALRRMYKAGLKGFILEFPDRYPEPPARKGFMEHEDYLAIHAKLEPDLQDVLDFGYWSGWRRGEVLGLEWSEVDLNAGEIRLPPERSKNKAGRTLPIPAPIMEVLERRAKLRHLNMRYVFHVDGEAIFYQQFYRRWKNAAKAAGLPGKLFHDLRRTVARNLIRAGVNEKVAMEWTGHKTASVFRTYNIVSKSDLEEAAVKLVAHVTNQPSKVAQFPEAKEKRK